MDSSRIANSPFETALALATCKSNAALTSNLAARLMALPEYKAYIHSKFSRNHPDSNASIEFANSCSAAELFAAGVIYSQLFGGMSSPLMLSLVSSQAEAIQ